MNEAPPDAPADAAIDAAATAEVSTRDKDEIRRVIKAQMSKLQYCMDKAHAAGAVVPAKVSVRFHIDEDGSVSSPSCGNPNLDACCATVLSPLKFEPGPDVMPIAIMMIFDTAGY